MKSRRTHNTNIIHTLPGGNEDNDLWAYYMKDSEGKTVICSIWEPTPEERQQIAAGHNIRLVVWGKQTPPVNLELTDEILGKAPDEEE